MRPLAFIKGNTNDKWSKWDYVLLRAHSMLDSFKCSQCGGHVWLCDEDLLKDCMTKTRKQICKRTKDLENKYRQMSGAKKDPKANKTEGVSVIIDYVPRDNGADNEEKQRMPSYASYLLKQQKL